MKLRGLGFDKEKVWRYSIVIPLRFQAVMESKRPRPGRLESAILRGGIYDRGRFRTYTRSHLINRMMTIIL
jgi:hypothetical protein